LVEQPYPRDKVPSFQPGDSKAVSRGVEDASAKYKVVATRTFEALMAISGLSSFAEIAY
jgi:hypothetical protein